MNELVIALITGGSIGILGSFHCIGMCGPIALALPTHQLPPTNRIAAIFLYNIGRAIGYSLMGLVIGGLGKTISQVFGWQQGLSMIAGIMILLYLLLRTFPRLLPKSNWLPNFGILHQQLSHYLHNVQKPTTYFTIGLLNAYLPCGLVYVALAAALALAHPANSALAMFGFGLGTMPLMVSVMVFSKYIALHWRQRINRLIPIFILFLGISLFVRGMGLNIPYLSPAIEQQGEKCAVSCCHKPK